jgi:catechol 2,3-dioxygenase-like lactoylglutathione lyase family enzyme
MSITGLSHITFIVSNLERSAALWRTGLGATEVYDSSQRNFSLSREKFFTLAGLWIALMQGKPSERSYRHVAFQASEAEIGLCEQRLRKMGVEISPPRHRVAGEGLSLYFYDYDNNLLELHSGTLEGRLASYAQLQGSPANDARLR